VALQAVCKQAGGRGPRPCFNDACTPLPSVTIDGMKQGPLSTPAGPPLEGAAGGRRHAGGMTSAVIAKATHSASACCRNKEPGMNPDAAHACGKKNTDQWCRRLVCLE